MSIMTGQQCGQVLCDLLGIDPRNTTRIAVVCDVKELARVYTTQLVHRRVVPCIKLSPRVNVSDGFRREFDEWLLSFFGTRTEGMQHITKRYTIREEVGA